ncbi:MAG: hypothetical protein M0Z28_21375 [Rhodospirillales bacterium]|nr:hypothetical protein [Rhodospirillales bacterium]
MLEKPADGRIISHGFARAANVLDHALIYRGTEQEALDAMEELIGAARVN